MGRPRMHCIDRNAPTALDGAGQRHAFRLPDHARAPGTPTVGSAGGGGECFQLHARAPLGFSSQAEAVRGERSYAPPRCCISSRYLRGARATTEKAGIDKRGKPGGLDLVGCGGHCELDRT